MLTKNSKYVFRHPRLKIRLEKFGGLAQSLKGVFLLGSEEFGALSNFRGYMSREQAEKVLGVNLLSSFLDAGFLLEIDRDLAEVILSERR